MQYLGFFLISFGVYFIVVIKKDLKRFKDRDIRNYYLFGVTLGIFFIVVGIFSILNFLLF